MRFLEEKKTAKSSRQITTAFLANYKRFMDIEVHEFPSPTNIQDLATSVPYEKDIADIRTEPTRRNKFKRTRKSSEDNAFEYQYASEDEYI